MDDPSERERIAYLARNCANLNLRKATRAITNYYDYIFLATSGLRITQIPPLAMLYLAGPRSINEIAERLELDRTTLTRNLKPLEEAGLLEVASGDDRRTHIVSLTERGKEALLGILPVWEEAQTHIVQGLGEERFDDLLNQLAEISELVREERH